MKVAFVSGNREQLPDAVIPLGLLYVMAAASDRHESALVDLEPTSLELAAGRLVDHRGDGIVARWDVSL